MSTAKPTKAAKKPAKASGMLAVKRQLRRTRPAFTRHAPHRKHRLLNNNHWKKPRGLHNKQKDGKKGSLPSVSDGYRTPEAVRGLHISGLAIAHVANVSQLAGLDPQTHGVVISSVGAKKQLAIIEACAKQNLRVLNHKADERAALLKKRHESRKSDVAAARKEKETKQSQSAKKTADHKHDHKETVAEHTKKEEKLKEEVLTSGN